MSIRKRRSLSASICTSICVNRLKTAEAKLLFTWLIPNCDDHGRMQGDEMYVKAKIFPMDDKITVKKTTGLLQDLHNKKLIIWYTIQNEKYIQIVKWNEFQSFHGVTKIDSTIPPPPDYCPPILVDESTKVGSKLSKDKLREDKLIKYADYVFLTEEEYLKLEQQHTKEVTLKLITILDNYKGSNGKKYKDDYRAILSWVIKTYEEGTKKAELW